MILAELCLNINISNVGWARERERERDKNEFTISKIILKLQQSKLQPLIAVYIIWKYFKCIIFRMAAPANPIVEPLSFVNS